MSESRGLQRRDTTGHTTYSDSHTARIMFIERFKHVNIYLRADDEQFLNAWPEMIVYG